MTQALHIPELRILLAEDDPAHQELLVRALLLHRPQVDVQVVESGAGFLAALREGDFHVGIIDYTLPDTTADVLLRRLGGRDVPLPIVVVSCNRDQQVVIDSMRSGSLDFVPKVQAIQPGTLWRRVTEAVARFQGDRYHRDQVERRQRELLEQAETDALTGLASRHHLERLRQEGALAEDRRHDTTAVMLDIDHFKRINDRYGHAAGDMVLRTVANLVRQMLPPDGIAVRWGGEEFLVLLRSFDLARAWAWCDEVASAVRRRHFEDEGRVFRVTVSMGLHAFATREFDSTVMAAADRALYLAKRRGRDRVCTAHMAEVAAALQQAEVGATGVLRQWQRFLEESGPLLGPTQQQHLGRHGRHVEALARKLALAAGLDEAGRERLALAGHLHDAGKCYVPESLLSQAGPLDDGQRRLLGRVRRWSAEIAAELGAARDVVELLEAADAPGRQVGPRGFEAQLLRAADALAALTSPRPYRAALTWTQALQELQYAVGEEFDRDAVAVAGRVGAP